MTLDSIRNSCDVLEHFLSFEHIPGEFAPFKGNIHPPPLMRIKPPLNGVVLSIFNFQTRLRTAAPCTVRQAHRCPLTSPKNSQLSYETLRNN